ncbi:membrane protein insertase YidC [Acinetobacter radioresistens]|jgi:YidC/Oxa1 family membrane protein insertase|uniref:Membrane protein insertase YidC n=1 Tax=Acinetobacter radioresistens TaxID=40216 RepID=A0A2T1IZT5_ACIRA|nr:MULTISPECIES: membrane protein insertase YidC [Acinetobacter]AWV87727.1 membrane protein insertase YidC [Acinetobacter radioresistens]EJO35925.1 membrane protein insertase, YidC/Oxa1 family [Acinetobacter radioresistens WC-A-157]ENV89931.1 membrane protein insertase, YidC/Oxa1 family domain [Acinetobacter radioresistens DSM 6976 = NBRC 102413 = CIP 103788]MCK4081165.1 membrane protein insertase YidC [Acinetobacter radioresistens]MCK4087949.1 membrane protein insertase YidC [Acinetobacter ra
MQQWARFAILGAMFVVAYLLILAWQKDYGHAETAPQQQAVVSHEVSADLPNSQAASASSDVPQANIATPQATDVTAPVNQQLISVQTDLYHLLINPKGGDIVRIELLNHDKNKDSDQPFVMLESDAKRTYVAQSGLIGLNGPDSNRSGRPVYEVEKTSYDLLKDAQTVSKDNGKAVKVLTIPMVYKTADGVEIIKTFTFKQGEYPIVVNHKVVNRSQQNWQGQMFGQIKRDNSEDPGKSDQGIFTLGTFLGGAWGTPEEHYNKLKFDNFNDEKLNVDAKGGWIAVVQHYFVSAWIPGQLKLTQANGQPYAAKLESRKSADDMNIISFTSPTINVPAGTVAEVDATFYSGPKIQSELKDLAVGLNQTVDYGWLWPIAKLLFLGLQFFHNIVGNWGWSIILLTILVKLILWPLSSKSYRSMAKMRVIAPEMQRMKEEFGEDRMRFSQEMMALYKREQVNPLSGCLPLLLQMPIFLALYWVLMESVELRHAPWFGWIQDLSAMDPWFILPLVMGLTMFTQQSLNPQPADPMQAKVFKIMPIIFTVFMLFFPAGLVLYWIVNNSITILQQWFINRSVKKERENGVEVI